MGDDLIHTVRKTLLIALHDGVSGELTIDIQVELGDLTDDQIIDEARDRNIVIPDPDAPEPLIGEEFGHMDLIRLAEHIAAGETADALDLLASMAPALINPKTIRHVVAVRGHPSLEFCS